MKIAALALAATLLLASAAPEPQPFFISMAAVEKVSCARGSGSGVRIDGDLVLTAAHVASIGGCTVDGEPTETVHFDGARDYAVLRTASESQLRADISCEGFVRGGDYYAIGFPFGQEAVVQRYIGTRSHSGNGLATLKGQVFPGMSGGPVVDARGQVVGIVNTGRRGGLALMGSRSLTETYLCGGGE